jgi:hypothetical protein
MNPFKNANRTLQYRNACSLNNYLMARITAEDCNDKDRALLMREWIACEQTKREWRGIPRLSNMGAKELVSAKLDSLTRVSHEPAFVELPPEPEPQTVSAPPNP